MGSRPMQRAVDLLRDIKFEDSKKLGPLVPGAARVGRGVFDGSFLEAAVCAFGGGCFPGEHRWWLIGGHRRGEGSSAAFFAADALCNFDGVV